MGSFSQNRDGLNHRGTENVLFIDSFLKDHKIDVGYCGHQLADLRDVARSKSRKNITK